MQPSPAPDVDDRRRADPALMIESFDDHLVIVPPDRLDLETTELLVVAAASALTSGSTVMIDLDPATASGDLVARRPSNDVAVSCVISDDGPVAILGPGYVRLTTRDAYWTIDLAKGRLCRSEHAVEPHFVGPDSWLRIHALWVTPTKVTALSGDGTYLSTRAAWTVRRRLGSLRASQAS